MPPARQLFADLYDADGDLKSNRALVSRHEELVNAMSKATYDGLTGRTWIEGEAADNTPLIKSRATAAAELRESATRSGFAKSANVFNYSDRGSGYTQLVKEWTLSSPIPSGIVPFDLEAPSKILVPRPTPLRNSLPRLRGQGSARRVKVITGWTGSGTGGVSTTQPGITENTLNTGPGGLGLIRPPYITYAGQDQVYNYTSWGLSDSVSFQAEFQGAGFEDLRSLSNTALMFSTMLLDERMILYGRGTTANGYSGALNAVTCTAQAVSASLAPGGTSTLGTSASVYVVVAPDAGDLLGTNGYSMHQGPASAATSVVKTGVGTTAVQVNIADSGSGALGYNLYAGSTSTGPFYYAGRTGYNVGYVTSQPTGGPAVTASGADQSAVSTNWDGLLTNCAASGGYVTRLNAAFNTSNPGTEFQTAFGTLYESVKGDPESVLMNGFDRAQLSNALLNNASQSAYRVMITSDQQGNAKAGVVVQSLLNEVTGSECQIVVHPFMPQGNALIRQETLPIPQSNVAETSYFALAQDMMILQWPAIQLTYDSSSFQVGALINVAPAWQGLISGIAGTGIGVQPPDFGDA
jgi:hypothetical protein